MLKDKKRPQAEALFVLSVLRRGEAEELLNLLDHPLSEGVIEVALEALTSSPDATVKDAIKAVVDNYC